MNETIFRKKSLDRIASPEQLDQYIKVSRPSVWLVLGAVLVFLVGVCVWGVFGRLETVVAAPARVQDGVAVLYLPVSKTVTDGMTVRLNGEEDAILEIGTGTTELPADVPADIAADVGASMAVPAYYYAILSTTQPNGWYSAKVVVESIAPMTFLWN